MNLPTNMTCAGTLYQYFETKDDDKAVYHGALHNDITRQTLEFIRTANKRSGANYGVRRGYIRFTEDRTVTNADGTTAVSPSVTSISVNFPVGVADTQAVVIQEIQKALGAMFAGNGNDVDMDSNSTAIFPGSVTEAYTDGHANAVSALVALANFFEAGQL
jgi:hypothetical protein